MDDHYRCREICCVASIFCARLEIISEINGGVATRHVTMSRVLISHTFARQIGRFHLVTMILQWKCHRSVLSQAMFVSQQPRPAPQFEKVRRGRMYMWAHTVPPGADILQFARCLTMRPSHVAQPRQGFQRCFSQSHPCNLVRLRHRRRLRGRNSASPSQQTQLINLLISNPHRLPFFATHLVQGVHFRLACFLDSQEMSIFVRLT